MDRRCTGHFFTIAVGQVKNGHVLCVIVDGMPEKPKPHRTSEVHVMRTCLRYASNAASPGEVILSPNPPPFDAFN